MAQQRVQLFGQARAVTVETAATVGATVDVDLRLPNGEIVTQAMLGGGSGVPQVVYWRTIADVPPNVQALANQTGAGIFVIDGAGGSAVRTIMGEIGEIDVVDGSGVAGNPTLGLADVTNAAGGAIQLTAFDAKGRATSHNAATTDNLTEGATNLWFTQARVRSTVLTGLSIPGTPSGILATDTVLQAFGKLQAQVSVKVAEAPSDGVRYARKDAAWVPGYSYDELKASLVAGANVTITPDDLAETLTITSTGGGGGGGVATVTAGTGISVNNTDPSNPVVALSSGSIASLALADTSLQPASIGSTVQAYSATLTNWAAIPPSGKANSGAIGSSGLTMNTARLLGRTTAGAGAPEEITVGSGLSIAGGVITATGGSGTVTSIDISGTTGITPSGGPITTSGSITLTLSANLQAWSGVSIPANTTTFLRGDGTFSNTLTGALTIGGTVTSNARFNSSTSNLLLQGQGGTIFLRPTAESTTGQTSIDASGNVVAAGGVSSGGTISSGNGNVVSATASVVLAPTGTGMVYLRPNGPGSATGQATVSSGGVFASSGTISAGNGNLISATGSVVVAPTGTGTVYLRPGGAGSSTGQATVDSSGNVTAVVFTSTSDVRLKRDLREFSARPIGRAVQLFDFAWRDAQLAGRRGLSPSAQAVRSNFPEYVRSANDTIGTLSIDKGGLSLEGVIFVQAQVDEIERRVDKLERCVEQILRMAA